MFFSSELFTFHNHRWIVQNHNHTLFSNSLNSFFHSTPNIHQA
nr:MAG TPA: hypothetical protein [Caudoviricetes sp.]